MNPAALGMPALAAFGLIGHWRFHSFSAVFAAIGFAIANFTATCRMRATLMCLVVLAHVDAPDGLNGVMCTRNSLKTA